MSTALVPQGGPPAPPDPTLRVLLPRFLGWLRFVREKSANTVVAYTRDLSMFIDFSEQMGLVYPAHIRVQHVETYMAWLRQARGLKAASANRHLAAIRALFKWLVREDLAAKNPAEFVAPLKTPHRLPVYLSVAEQERLLAALALPIPPHCKNRTPSARKWTRTWVRDRALVATLIFTGLRVSEISTLRLADVDLEAGTPRVVGKGDRERVGVIIPRLAEILRHYIVSVRPIFMARRPSDYLFISNLKGFARRGQSWRTDRPIPPRILHAVVSRRVESILGRPCWPHMLRHSFASRLREHGAGIELIQEALGHADVRSTMIYAHLTSAKRKTEIAKFLEGSAPA